MLMPKRVKYRRVQRGRLKGKATSGNKVTNGSYGLVALEPAWVTNNQIEAARIAMTRYIRRGGKVWIKIFPPWDSPGKNTGVGCHFLLQCMQVKRESKVAQSCPTLCDPMDCSLLGSSVHGSFQSRVLEWGAIAFSAILDHLNT